MNWISTNVIKSKLEKLSVLLLSNNLVIRFKDGKFTLGFFRFGEIRMLETVQAENIGDLLDKVTLVAQEIPVLEVTPTNMQLSPIVYNLNKNASKPEAA